MVGRLGCWNFTTIALVVSLSSFFINDALAQPTVGTFTANRVYTGNREVVHTGGPPRWDDPRIVEACFKSLDTAIARCKADGGEPVPGPNMPNIETYPDAIACTWSIGCYFRSRPRWEIMDEFEAERRAARTLH